MVTRKKHMRPIKTGSTNSRGPVPEQVEEDLVGTGWPGKMEVKWSIGSGSNTIEYMCLVDRALLETMVIITFLISYAPFHQTSTSYQVLFM